MRKQYFLLVLVITVIISCSSTPKFSDVSGKNWKLIEVNVDDRVILFDRNTLTKEDAGDIFTFNFDAQNINGKGAPNLYAGPYTLGADQAIKLNPVSSTTMAPLKQPEKLREYDFFVFLQNAYKWNLVDKKLELYSKTEDDAEVKMVFSL
jgi:heat shock protein HslJ